MVAGFHQSDLRSYTTHIARLSSRISNYNTIITMTKTLEFQESVTQRPSERRLMKVAIEKKRRARINTSLNELKTLLEVTFGQQIPRDSKLEKADILELAVVHLKQRQRHLLATSALQDATVMDKYQVGYSECVSEVSRYMTTAEGIDESLRPRVIEHLSNKIANKRAPSSTHTPSRGESSNNNMSPSVSYSRGPLQMRNSNVNSGHFVRENSSSFSSPIFVDTNFNYSYMNQKFSGCGFGLLSTVQSNGRAPLQHRFDDNSFNQNIWRPW